MVKKKKVVNIKNRTAQPKKEYGKLKNKEYKEPKVKVPQVSNPDDVVSVSMTRKDLFFIQKKVEATNLALAEYVKHVLEVTEKQKEEIEKARLSEQELEQRKAEDANRRY